MRRYRTPVIVILTSVIIFFIVLIAVISPVTKYIIEKYDTEFSSREIVMERAYVNPLTGYISFSGLKIYEPGSDSVFFSVKGINANFAMLKLISGKYEISDLTLDSPAGYIIQRNKELNFSDLIERFTPSDRSTPKKNRPHFSILGINIINGAFYYTEQLIPVSYFVKNVNLKSSGKKWNNDVIVSAFSLSQGVGTGDIEGTFSINTVNKDYSMAIVVRRFDLNIMEQYLRDITNYGTFSAILDADIKSNGNFDSIRNFTTSGIMNLHDFHFGKNKNEDYASFDKLVFAMKEISPGRQVFAFDSISLSRPYFKYERYDYLDNLQTMFGENGEKIDAANDNRFNLILEIAEYIKELTVQVLRSNYRVDKFAIYDGDIRFNDYSLSEKFAAGLSPLNVFADSVNKKHDRVDVSLTSGIKPYGNISVHLSINPRDSSDFDLRYHLEQLSASQFNPYIISQTSYPLDRGTIELKGTWKVRNGEIQSDNHLSIIDPRIASRQINDDLKWFPMRPVMALVRERGNVIDYEIPIGGNLKDPKFKINDVVFDVLENIFVKPVSTPYIMQVRSTESEIEQHLSVTWDMRQSVLSKSEEKFMRKMADYLEDNPGVTITIHPMNYTAKEREYLLYFEAKKQYYKKSRNISETSFDARDSNDVETMSVKDSLFVQYLDGLQKDSSVFTILGKCENVTDAVLIKTKLNQLSRDREAVFLHYFSNPDASRRVIMAKSGNIVPFNGYSYYQISYKGELPGVLSDAYRQMNRINNKAPRNKFRKERMRGIIPG